MKNCNAPENQTTRRILLIACATALAVAFTVSLPQPAHAADPVPTNIQVPAGNKAFLDGHAVGTQNYICLPSGTGFAWTFFGPQATLFDDDDEQVITHFLSPNPDEGGTPRATWQHSQDTSAVWAMSIAVLLHPRLRRAGCHSLAPAAGGWSPRRTNRWPQADGDHLHPAAEHLRRGRALDRLYPVNRRRPEGVGALHGRLLLLQGRRKRRGRRRLGSLHKGCGRTGRHNRPVLSSGRSSSVQGRGQVESQA